MKLTIGSVDYSASVVATEKFLIERQLNQPSLCSFTLAPSGSLPTPARNSRVMVADNSGNLLFTGYIATEPALELLGQSSAGDAYQAFVSAVSDETLLNQQPLLQLQTGVAQPANQMLENLTMGLDTNGLSLALSQTNGTVSEYLAEPGKSWSESAGAVASMARSAYRVLNGAVTMTPIGSVVHTLNESEGTLSLSQLEASMVKTLANDITVCGPDEPAAYVAEFFQGDGTTVLFDLTEEPYMPPASKAKPLMDLFQEPTINPQLWQVADPGSRLSITSAGLTCTGGDGIDGDTTLTTLYPLEIGGALVIEAGGVLLGSATQGILNGLYNGSIHATNCVAGFQVSAGGAVTPLIAGSATGTAITLTAGHLYTLRLRISCNEMQRVEQAYVSLGNSGTQTYGGEYLAAGANVVLEVQDTTGGVAAAPVVLYSGSLANAPSVATLALVNSANLQCSVASIEVSQQGPVWVVSTPPNSGTIVRRMGTTAQGADCRVERTGTLRFYPASTPQVGELIAVSYRTAHRSVARLANAASITAESNGGTLPGTAVWLGTVTSPAPRSSLDCENAASALLDLSTNRGAAWKGKYTAWNMELQTDVWPGDVLALAAVSANLNANVVVRSVRIEFSCTVPALAKYVVSFANDWADALAIRTSTTVSVNTWLPLQPETTPSLANLAALNIVSVTGSAIQVNAAATPPTNGGFEVRRRDWAFGPGTNSDLVLRSPVSSFTIPREAAMEQYYIRMYDGSTPPNYSRFSSAVFVNVPL